MKIPNPTPSLSRRQFLYASGLSLASAALSGQRILGANDRIRYAVVGCGGRSVGLIEQFFRAPNVELVALCDPDTARTDLRLADIERIKGELKEKGIPFIDSRIETYQDYRRVYERNDIDAIIIASPNYWHTLHGIQALQSGKHVYLEKPVSFSPWEGRQLEAASEQFGKIIVAGYQNRSDPGPQSGIKYVQDGNLGKILKVRALCYRNRDSIGAKLPEPLKIPSTVDYNLWLGPVQEHEIKRPRLHYDWHWDFNTGNGDMGNQGVHETDMVYWLLGHPGLPSEINCFGNRFVWNDAGNTPNMQTLWCRWGGAEVILETNDIKMSPERNVSPNRMGTRVGIIAECEGGYLKGGRGGMVAVEKDKKTVIEKFKGDGGGAHQKSFIRAIRNNDVSECPAQIATSHPAEAVMHLGNAAYRMGALQSAKELADSLTGNDDLLEIIEEQNQQLNAWGITDPNYYRAKTVRIDPKTSEVISPDFPINLVGPNYREEFTVPRLI